MFWLKRILLVQLVLLAVSAFEIFELKFCTHLRPPVYMLLTSHSPLFCGPNTCNEPVRKVEIMTLLFLLVS